MKILPTYLPWHVSIWQVLKRCQEEGKLPHALLFTGIAGVGKQLFSQVFAKSLLCVHPKSDGLFCDSCCSCQWLAAGTHPDWLEIVPEDEKKPIKIDQIRKLVEFNHKTASLNMFKVILVQKAHALNIHAANALLKTLEEPTANTLIILVTEHLMMLPATIRSRCQIIYFPTPSDQIALPWLQNLVEKDHLDRNQNFSILLSLAQGAPLKALEFLEQGEMAFRKGIFEQWLDYIQDQSHMISLAAKWSKLDLDRLFMHWKSWITDMICLKQTGDSKRIKNQDIMDDLKRIISRKDCNELYRFLDELNQSHQAVRAHSNLNLQLMIDNLLLLWIGVDHAIS